MKFLVFSSLLAFAVAVSVPRKVPVSVAKNVHPDIIHGKEAVPHSIPYQVWLLVDSDEESWSCGGSLVSSKYVLTAGHCVYGGTYATITLGAHNINKAEDTQLILSSKRLILHPEYDTEIIGVNDIGLIELEKEVQQTDAIKVGPISNEVNNTFEGETAKISGWGLTKGTNENLSPVLMYEEDKIISNEECDMYFWDDLYDYNICLSADSGRGACNGDSGGPLTIDGKIVGVFSYMAYECVKGYPSIFTRTGSFLDWIQDNSDVVV